MAEPCVIVVDLGSSSLRAHAIPIAHPWQASSSTARAYGVRRGPGGLLRSMNPAVVRKRLVEAIAAVAHRTGAQHISAIAVTAQRGGAAFLDAHGATLYLGPNKDLRAVFEGAAMDEEHGVDIYAATGHLPSLLFTPAKVRWWREHRPGDAKRIAQVLTLGAWAVHALSGEAGETAASLGEAGLLDVATHPPRTANKVLARLGIGPELLPPMLGVGSPTGALTSEAARSTGLAAQTPVYLAGPDAQTAMLGMGAIMPGDAGIIAGWSAPVQRVTSSPVFDTERRTWTGLHLLDGRWVLEANPSDTGETVDAVRRLLRLSQARFNVLAAEQNDAAENIMAFWGPRALNLASPTMSVGGLLTPSPVTHQGLSAGAVARATLENAAFAMRECSELLESVLAKNAEMSGARDQAISLSGGMSQSRVFPQMLASVLGTPVLLHTPLATAAGAAIAVSRATGEWMQTAHDARGKALLIEPDPHDALRHDERYRRWLSLREWLDSLADEL